MEPARPCSISELQTLYMRCAHLPAAWEALCAVWDVGLVCLPCPLCTVNGKRSSRWIACGAGACPVSRLWTYMYKWHSLWVCAAQDMPVLNALAGLQRDSRPKI